MIFSMTQKNMTSQIELLIPFPHTSRSLLYTTFFFKLNSTGKVCALEKRDLHISSHMFLENKSYNCDEMEQKWTPKLIDVITSILGQEQLSNLMGIMTNERVNDVCMIFWPFPCHLTRFELIHEIDGVIHEDFLRVFTVKTSIARRKVRLPIRSNYTPAPWTRTKSLGISIYGCDNSFLI